MRTFEEIRDVAEIVCNNNNWTLNVVHKMDSTTIAIDIVAIDSQLQTKPIVIIVNLESIPDHATMLEIITTIENEVRKSISVVETLETEGMEAAERELERWTKANALATALTVNYLYCELMYGGKNGRSDLQS